MKKSNRNQIKLRKSTKKGTPPGTPIYIGQDREQNSTMTLYTYNPKEYKINKAIGLHDLKGIDKSNWHWLNVIGINNSEFISKICNQLGIHVLTSEDILNTQTRSKSEISNEYIFSVLKLFKNEDPLLIVEEEQVSLVLFENLVISFQEVESDIFEPIRHRIANENSRLRSKGVDYLFCLFHDIIVDNVIEIVDLIEEQNDNLETEITSSVSTHQLLATQSLKKDIVYIKKHVMPMKEAVGKLIRTPSPLIRTETIRFFDDILDHLDYVADSLDSQTLQTVGNRELYMSMMEISMSNVMKVLTVVTSIFIPLTFIVGVYGMNFENMPELKTQYGYYYVMCGMLLLALLMVFYFKKKKWF
jgi:magnesium transporter